MDSSYAELDVVAHFCGALMLLSIREPANLLNYQGLQHLGPVILCDYSGDMVYSGTSGPP